MHPARIAPVQWLRAIAATLVLFVHGEGAIGKVAVPIVGAFVPSIPNLAVFGASGVDLFFIISGFVMAHALATRPLSPARFLGQRWLRIVPVFAVMSALYLALAREPVAIQSVLMSVLVLPVFDTAAYHAPALNVGWTLGFEFAFYALVAVAIPAGRHRVAALLALTVGAGLCGLVVHAGWAPLRLLLNPLQFEFALGVAIWAAWRRGWTRRWSGPAMFAGVLLLAASIAVGLGTPVNLHYAGAADGSAGLARSWTWGLPWALVVIGTVDLPGDGRVAAWVAKVGDASYATYLVHPCLVAALALGVVRFPPVSAAVFVPLFAAASTMLGLLVHRWVERPMLAALTRPGTRRPAGQVAPA